MKASKLVGMALNEAPHFIILLFLCISSQAIINAAASNLNASKHPGKWVNHGGDIFNRRYAYDETQISPSTAPGLKLRWKFRVGYSVSATPAIYKGILYFTSWHGLVYAVKASDGYLVWARNVTELTGVSTGGRALNINITVSRSTPTVAGADMLILGMTGPAYIFALRRTTGDLIWSTLIDENPLALITMSGTYYDRGYYVGVSSLEEILPLEQCCTFRGSLVKLDAKTGKIIWRTYTLPDNHGRRGQYSGAAIWGSSPSIDTKRNFVYIATGNLYSAPQRIEKCQERLNNLTTPPENPDQCIEPENHSNSIMALDMSSGKIRWYKQLGGYDVWFVACANLSKPHCPVGPNPDADFGEAPMMLTVSVNGTKKDIVVAVQKSGFAWAVDRDNGKLVWFTEAGPGGVGGGGTWGAATDRRNIYTNIANSNRLNFTLHPSNRVISGGGWVALDAKTGGIKWSTAEPKSMMTGPVTVANGVLFGGSTDRTGPIYAIDATTGEILWSYETGATLRGGVSVSDGCIFVGHGYRAPVVPVGIYLFAFCTGR